MSKQHTANPGQTNEGVGTTANEFFAEEAHKSPHVALRTRRRPRLGAKRLPKSPAPNVSQLVATLLDFPQYRVPKDLHQAPGCPPSPYTHVSLVTVVRNEYSSNFFYVSLNDCTITDSACCGQYAAVPLWQGQGSADCEEAPENLRRFQGFHQRVDGHKLGGSATAPTAPRILCSRGLAPLLRSGLFRRFPKDLRLSGGPTSRGQVSHDLVINQDIPLYTRHLHQTIKI